MMGMGLILPAVTSVKRRQRTHAASGGASEALPHEVGARPSRSEPKLNTHALYPSRSELRGITFKNNFTEIAFRGSMAAIPLSGFSGRTVARSTMLHS
jgi:hypothetical protein